MPDVHLGKGATIGSVIPTVGGDYSGGGGRGLGLRDDGGENDVDRSRFARFFGSDA